MRLCSIYNIVRNTLFVPNDSHIYLYKRFKLNFFFLWISFCSVKIIILIWLNFNHYFKKIYIKFFFKKKKLLHFQLSSKMSMYNKNLYFKRGDCGRVDDYRNRGTRFATGFGRISASWIEVTIRIHIQGQAHGYLSPSTTGKWNLIPVRPWDLNIIKRKRSAIGGRAFPSISEKTYTGTKNWCKISAS